MRTSNNFPCSLACPPRGQDGSFYGVKVEVCPGVRPEGWFRGMPAPLVVVCAGGTRSTPLLLQTVFAPSSSEVAVGVSVFLYLVVHNLPQ